MGTSAKYQSAVIKNENASAKPQDKNDKKPGSPGRRFAGHLLQEVVLTPRCAISQDKNDKKPGSPGRRFAGRLLQEVVLIPRCAISQDKNDKNTCGHKKRAIHREMNRPFLLKTLNFTT